MPDNNKIEIGLTPETPINTIDDISAMRKLPDKFFEIYINIGGQVYDLIVDEMLQIKKNYQEWTKADIDYHLERTSIFRFTYASAAQDLFRHIEALKEDFIVFYAKWTIKAQSDILKYRLQQKENGIPMSTWGSLTKADIENWIVLSEECGSEYRERKDKLAEYQATFKKLTELRDIMTQRGADLRYFGNSEIELKKMATYRLKLENES